MTITHWLRFIARRLALMMLTLWLITLLIFVITSVIPGDAAQYMLGQNATPETLAALRARLGLDQPAHVRYLRWVGNALHGDLGISAYLNGPIGPTLALRLRNSLVLGVLGFAFAVPLAILLGIIAGMRAGRPLDRFISVTSLVGLSLPEFVGAVVLTLVFSSWLGLVPPSSMMEADASPWQHLDRLILPALTATIVILAYIVRMTRASVADVASRQYVRAARLRGVARGRLISQHVLRNALLPTITVVFNSMGWLFGGLIIVESFFAYPGVARLLLAGVDKNDFPLLQATTLVIAVITLGANFLADILYGVMDPRIRL